MRVVQLNGKTSAMQKGVGSTPTITPMEEDEMLYTEEWYTVWEIGTL